MTVEQIMSDHAEWATWHRTAHDCHYAICVTIDPADYWKSWVLLEDTLNAEGIMEEAMK